MYMLWSKWVKLKLENLNLNYQYVNVSLYIGTHATVNQLYSPATKFQEIYHLHLLHANNSWYNSGSHTIIKKNPTTYTTYQQSMIFINNSNCKTDIAFPLYFINLPCVCGKKLYYSVFLFTEQFFKILWKHLLDHTHITDTKVKVQKFKFVICRNHVKITFKTNQVKSHQYLLHHTFNQSEINIQIQPSLVRSVLWTLPFKFHLLQMKWKFKIKLN